MNKNRNKLSTISTIFTANCPITINPPPQYKAGKSSVKGSSLKLKNPTSFEKGNGSSSHDEVKSLSHPDELEGEGQFNDLLASVCSL